MINNCLKLCIIGPESDVHVAFLLITHCGLVEYKLSHLYLSVRRQTSNPHCCLRIIAVLI
jgi:hypothetical protein